MQLLTTMPGGRRVYYDPADTHLAPHLATDPQLLGLVGNFLHATDFAAPLVEYEHDTGRIVGMTDEVGVDDPGAIFYARRRGYDTYTPFVRGTPQPSTYVSFCIALNAAGDYELRSAWVGRQSPPYPDQPNAPPESRTYWARHALVFGAQPVDEASITTVCPW